MSNAETRLHFRIGYLGDSYHGSQIQPDVITVQGELIRVFQTLGWISKTKEEHKHRIGVRWRSPRGMATRGQTCVGLYLTCFISVWERINS